MLTIPPVKSSAVLMSNPKCEVVPSPSGEEALFAAWYNEGDPTLHGLTIATGGDRAFYVEPGSLTVDLGDTRNNSVGNRITVQNTGSGVGVVITSNTNGIELNGSIALTGDLVNDSGLSLSGRTISTGSYNDTLTIGTPAGGHTDVPSSLNVLGGEVWAQMYRGGSWASLGAVVIDAQNGVNFTNNIGTTVASIGSDGTFSGNVFSATNASYADSAGFATSAGSANTATTADSATSAGYASDAGHASSADVLKDGTGDDLTVSSGTIGYTGGNLSMGVPLLLGRLTGLTDSLLISFSISNLPALNGQAGMIVFVKDSGSSSTVQPASGSSDTIDSITPGWFLGGVNLNPGEFRIFYSVDGSTWKTF